MAELGNVIHHLLEVAGRGQLAEATKEKVDETWTLFIKEAENRMLQSQIRKLLVPLSKSISDFEVRRLRACRRAAEVAHESQNVPRPSAKDSLSRTGFELWIETNDRAVGGYIDRAKKTDRGIVLLDFKSGAVLERDSGGAYGVREAYKDQMALYAALYHNKFGEWPESLEIIPLQGAAVKLKWEPACAERLLASARRLLRDINLKIADVQRGNAKASSLASPSTNNCMACLFRPACHAYWTVREHDPTKRWPIDVRGILKEKAVLRNGMLCLRITADPSTPNDVIGIRNVSSIPQRHPMLSSLEVGNQIAVYCLKYLYRSCDYTETQSTVIFRTD